MLSPAMRIEKALQRATEESLTRLTETLFIKELLPFLANEAGDESLNIQQLVTLAKGHYNPIVIVDNKGNELFRVPPLLHRLETGNVDRAESISGVLADDEAYRRNGQAALADAMLIKRFNKLTIEDTADVTLHWLKEWIKIENRYNVEIPRFNNVRDTINKIMSNDNSTTVPMQTSSEDLTEDDFEDDDD